MKEEIKLFLQKAIADEELQEKLSACKTPEEAYEVASSVQDGFTYEEFVEAGRQIKEAYASSQELTDEDLAKAAGGVDWTEIIVDTLESVLGTLIAAALFT